MPAENLSKNPEHMSAHERLVALRLLDRRLGKVKKLWNGKVSECRTEADHLVDASTPDSDRECRSRLEAIKGKLDELETMKSDRKTAVDAIKRAWDEILYAKPATAEQLELGATRMPITKEAVRELSAAFHDAVADDKAAAESGETPKLPPEKAGDMDDLRARLDALLADAGLDAVTLAEPIPEVQADADLAGDEPEPERPANTGKRGTSKGRGNLSAVT